LSIITPSIVATDRARLAKAVPRLLSFQLMSGGFSSNGSPPESLERSAYALMTLTELARVIAPGGRLLMSVPAYQWAWSDHDVRAGHHRRYTKARLLDAIGQTDLSVIRSTYAFSAVFPFFAAERVVRRLKGGHDSADPTASRLPEVSPMMDKVLMGLTRAEEKVIRSHNLPFGSSVLVAAVKSTPPGPDGSGAVPGGGA
jgi:hypothetical protein